MDLVSLSSRIASRRKSNTTRTSLIYYALRITSLTCTVTKLENFCDMFALFFLNNRSMFLYRNFFEMKFQDLGMGWFKLHFGTWHRTDTISQNTWPFLDELGKRCLQTMSEQRFARLVRSSELEWSRIKVTTAALKIVSCSHMYSERYSRLNLG